MSIRDRMEKFAKVMNIDLKKDCGMILEGLFHNEVKYGVAVCPCAFTSGKPIRQHVCPCADAYRVADNTLDECHCGLFVMK